MFALPSGVRRSAMGKLGSYCCEERHGVFFFRLPESGGWLATHPSRPVPSCSNPPPTTLCVAERVCASTPCAQIALPYEWW